MSRPIFQHCKTELCSQNVIVRVGGTGLVCFNKLLVQHHYLECQLSALLNLIEAPMMWCGFMLLKFAMYYVGS